MTTVVRTTVIPAPAGGRVLDFRRRGVPPPRRRRSNPLLALFRPMVTAFVLVTVPVALAAWVLTASRFQLREVVVKGGSERVPSQWVLRALAPLEGGNLVLLSLTEAAERLQKNPWIASVEIEKELPDRLRVEVEERRPVALLRSGAKLAYADQRGEPIASVASGEEEVAARRAGLLEVSFVHAPHPEGVAAALEVAGDLGRVQPDWAAHLSRIEVLGEEDFRLHTKALPFPLLVTKGQVGPKARRFQELLPELVSRYPKIESVDLRFSRRIVVQPALPSPLLKGGTGA
ncbi:MAG TPA: FtsQ-type POTRA domain-containing protein [Thermoanaerobaculia bacterium]|nr:FtsQ-type POTRA domain-containing protein [Thermoanaerobaculia bacterium]